MTNAILTGMLGGMYALIAMGLTLQYGVARIMNLSYGEFLIAAAFASHWLFTGWAISPFGGAYYSYSYLAFPVQFVGETVAANRLAALGITIALGLVLYLALTRTRA